MITIIKIIIKNNNNNNNNNNNKFKNNLVIVFHQNLFEVFNPRINKAIILYRLKHLFCLDVSFSS